MNNEGTKSGFHWILLVLGGFGLLVLSALLLALWFAEGEFTYGLDDAYIHLALAKNLINHGVWGATPFESSACSSSIIWPLLLSVIFFFFGQHELASFVLSLLIASAFLVWLASTVGRHVGDMALRKRFIVLFVLASCLLELVFIGMEHILQVWLCVWFAYRAAVTLSRSEFTPRNVWPLIVLAALATSVRYESLGLVAVVCCMLVAKSLKNRQPAKGLALATILGGAAWLPVAIFGVVMFCIGLPLLPYSVQLKTWTPHVAFSGLWIHFGPKFLFNALLHPELVFLLMCCIYSLWAKRRDADSFWTVPAILQTIYVLSCLLHLEFAITGPYSRYVAYLTSIGMLGLGLDAGPLFFQGLRLRPKHSYPSRLSRFLAAGTIVTLILLGLVSHLAIPQRARNIYQQQKQMSRFLAANFEGDAVVLNDIGAACYEADIILVDIFGLASKDVAEKRLHGDFKMGDIERIAEEKGAKVAMVYKNWFVTGEGSMIPPHWECVGEWKIPFNLICAEDTVSIYSLDPLERDSLVEKLVAFSADMPKAVVQLGPYTEIAEEE